MGVIFVNYMECSSLTGWQGNQAQKQNMQLQQAMVPPVHQAMMG